MEVIVEQYSNLEQLTSALDVSTDELLKGISTQIQKQVNILKTNILNNETKLRYMKSDLLVHLALTEYLTKFKNKNVSFKDIDTHSLYYDFLRSYAFSLIMDMILKEKAKLEKKGIKLFLEIDYPKQMVTYALIYS